MIPRTGTEKSLPKVPEFTFARVSLVSLLLSPLRALLLW